MADEEKYAIIDGVAYMQAAPSWQHQSISAELVTQFSNYLKFKATKNIPYINRASK